MSNESIIERDADELAAEAYAEMDGKEEVVKEEPESVKEKPKPEETEEGETEAQTEGESDEQDGDSEEAGDAEEVKDEEADEEDIDKKITDYAEKHRMTYAEAKTDIEKTEDILKQFKQDPVELARAIRNKDREYEKLRVESEKKVERKPLRKFSDDEFRSFAKDKMKETPEYIDMYKKRFPGKSEVMTDEAIAEEIVEQELVVYHQKFAEEETKLKKEATKVREDLINSISEADKRFIPDVKANLQEIDDIAIVNGFDIQDVLYWAKGKAYDKDIKEAEARAKKRLSEDPKIIGSKSSSSGHRPTKAQGDGGGMTKSQKNRAIEMFGDDTSDDEKCYQLYRETFPEDFKKK